MQLIGQYFHALSAKPNQKPNDETACPEGPQLSEILNDIDAHLNDADLSVNNLIAHFNLSRSALYRLFETEGGIAEAIRERRLRFAYRLLLKHSSQTGRQPLIRDLALGLGFSSEAHFSRVFKARFGLTPRAVREQQQQPRIETCASTATALEVNNVQVEHYYKAWMQSLKTPDVPPRANHAGGKRLSCPEIRDGP